MAPDDREILAERASTPHALADCETSLMRTLRGAHAVVATSEPVWILIAHEPNSHIFPPLPLESTHN